ncbi:hypothetical protein [Nesterenkonia jeotgali]|uniref:DUF1795 domain-containing protein n=1 Tax=Nesterenkonia jeotgali TaxID=317018 RepID=A0A839FXY4_9MICC|nr:hypothetical protein [Nesterenkonia jeotgali]MBA8921914.1 hypothetical protein [Nesterenkonia jeotgali]
MSSPNSYDHPRSAVILYAPPEWDFDDSGLDDGLVIGRAREPELMGFHPNVTLIQVPLDGEVQTPEATLAGQQQAEPGLQSALRDYRLLQLDYDEVGAQEVPGVMRSAAHTTEEGVPVTLHQWVARRSGVEVSMTVTFPTALLPDWINISWMMRSALEWKETAS